jgi:hypothetical protein
MATRLREVIIQTKRLIEYIGARLLFSLFQARILRHGGDAPAAAALAEEARSLDLADRYLNNEAVKRFLNADQVDDAEKTAALFTKDGEQHNSLFDMQCMW